MKKYLITLLIMTLFNSAYADWKALAKRHGLKGESISFYAFNTETQKTLHNSNENNPRILASVTKILSLYYSLSILGADHTFKTSLHTTGEVKNGVLEGNIYLKGGGDPYLSPAQLMSMVHALKLRGITKVNGSFFYDHSLLIPSSKLSPIGLEDQPDNPAIGALNVDFNRFRVFRSKKVLPPLDHINIEQPKAALPKGLNYSFNKDTSNWLKSKSAKSKYIESLPARDAGLFTANYFKYLSENISIELPEPKHGKTPNAAKLLNTHESLPLWRLASLAIEYSNNMFAELPALMAARAQTKKTINVEDAASEMHSFLKTKFSKINFKKATLVNSSGLSIENRMSAKTMALFLNEIKDEQFNERGYWTLFSINGRSGWLSKRLMHPDYAYRVWAKTGSLYYVSNIAGYYLNKKGQRVAFAIFITDDKHRQILNSPLSENAYKTRKLSKKWANNSKKFIDQLLLSWLN